MDKVEANTEYDASRVVAATESRHSIGKRMPLPKKWERFLGYMYRDTRYLVKGSEGTRKSTFMLKFADMCGRMGNVLYVLAEEKLSSGTIQAREKLAKVNLNNVYYLDNPTYDKLRSELSSGKYAVVIIDSVNSLETKEHPQEDIMNLWVECPAVYAYVLQMKKDRKEYKGGASIRHFVDVVVETEVVNGRYYATQTGKNRFRHESPTDTMPI